MGQFPDTLFLSPFSPTECPQYASVCREPPSVLLFGAGLMMVMMMMMSAFPNTGAWHSETKSPSVFAYLLWSMYCVQQRKVGRPQATRPSHPGRHLRVPSQDACQTPAL